MKENATVKAEAAPAQAGSKWSCDAATGALYEDGVEVGKLITGSGAWLRLIEQANAVRAAIKLAEGRVV